MISAFLCAHALALDGDTFDCAGGPRVRIARIDAPELPGHCRPGRACAPGDPFAARAALVRLLASGPVRCQPVAASPRGGSPYDRYGRVVARVTVAGRDVGAALLAGGYVIRWPHR